MPPSAPFAGSPDWRPRLHFTTPRGWINDPNGLVRVGDAWHLQYQFEWPRRWGHAASRDLFHWEHLPVALEPDALGDCWSGGTVHDPDNRSGLFPSGMGGLVSVYTSQDQTAGQRLSLASSSDGGRTWTKYPGNPVLRRARRDCRDPKVFWDARRQRWAMVMTEGTHLTFFHSPNLRDWRETGRYEPILVPGADGVECPDLFPLGVAGSDREKWILSYSYLSAANFPAEGHGFGVCAQRYLVGEYDGERFEAEAGHREFLPLGHGPDEYAAIIWPRETDPFGRTLLIGWMNHWGYAKQIPTDGWQGCLTLPRELTLHEESAGHFRLRQAPARELWQWPQAVSELGGGELKTGQIRTLGALTSGAIEITFKPEAGASVAIDLFAQGPHRTVVGYDAASGVLWFDRQESGSPAFHDRFPLRHDVPVALDRDGCLALLIIVDRSTVEVFAQGGKAYLSGQTFPPAGAEAASVRAVAGRVEVTELRVRDFVATA
ncbi:MAG TPA: glycoside hydrolase family 32 protein [Opitutaceae bacterium]|nr:glycoside hydrolase family 32 protein [Opitutaceae bacterium]HND60096.1 glycoside hydrolase family 32 protein [Opitutaceae bacterium]